MRIPFAQIREKAQYPVAILLLPFIMTIAVADFVIDHINTPLANMIDKISLNLLREIGPNGVMLAGGVMHSHLYYFYLTAIEFSIPALNALISNAAQQFALLEVVTTALSPAVTFALPYLFMGISGLIVLNQLVCMKKIFSESNTNTSEQASDEQAIYKLEHMRSNPIQTALSIAKILVSTSINIPPFMTDSYQFACDIKTNVVSRLPSWLKGAEQIPAKQNIANQEDESNSVTSSTLNLLVTVAGDTDFPLQTNDPQLKEDVEELNAPEEDAASENSDVSPVQSRSPSPVLFDKRAKGSSNASAVSSEVKTSAADASPKDEMKEDASKPFFEIRTIERRMTL